MMAKRFHQAVVREVSAAQKVQAIQAVRAVQVVQAAQAVGIGNRRKRRKGKLRSLCPHRHPEVFSDDNLTGKIIYNILLIWEREGSDGRSVLSLLYEGI